MSSETLPTDDRDPANKRVVTMSRLIVSAIPYLGAPATLLIDKKINDQKNANVTAFCNELSRRLVCLENAEYPAESNIELAAKKAQEADEPWKPVFLARIAAAKRNDLEPVVQKLLIQHASQLGEIDFSMLTSFRAHYKELSIIRDFSEIRESLSAIEQNSRIMRDIRNASHLKLERLGFLARDDGDNYQSTNLADDLIRVLSE